MANRPKPRVLHITTTTHTGGAEMLLAAGIPIWAEQFDQAVLCLSREGTVAERIKACGVEVTCLDMDNGFMGLAGAPWRLLAARRRLRRWGPDLLVGWMYHGDGLAEWLRGSSPLADRPRRVWTIHQTPSVDLSDEKLLTRRIIRWLARLSSRGMPVVYAAVATRDAHLALGFDRRNARVIDTGADTSVFKPDPDARQPVRRELGVSDDALLLGRFGRWHAMKDYGTCLKAFALLRGRGVAAELVLAGEGVSWDAPGFRAEAAAAGFSGDSARDGVHALGRRDDMARLTAALDVATSTSSDREALPLVTSEAMACGVPCVVTDVGDSRRQVGDTGRVVPPGDPERLARAWEELLILPSAIRVALGSAARARVRENFELGRMFAAYAGLFAEQCR